MSETAAAAELLVAVRALCEFSAKTGDLDLRFTPAPTALEGMAGHALVAGRRGSGYQTELSLSGVFVATECGTRLRVRGRADGWDAGRQRLEEIKTHKGSLDAQPANHRALHWAQLKVYGALLCAQEGLARVELALVYFDVLAQSETVFAETQSAADLQAFFAEQCGRYVAWAQQEQAHREARDAALLALAFPHADFRRGQRALAEGVYKAAVSGRVLLAQAPTGIGKTVGTIFPMLKAMPGQKLDKLFFLTAKSSGRQLALEGVEKLKTPPGSLRVLELVARDKACEHPDKACHGESCPLAQGFYDRLPQARAAAVQSGLALERAAVRALALAFEVCPYYLSQELVRWADVAVGDYNYFFDSSALLHGLSQQNGWRVGLLADEAHNLLERGRKMYSAELEQDSLRGAKLVAPPSLKAPLDRLQRAWTKLSKSTAGEEAAEPYQVLKELPEAWMQALQQATAAISEQQQAGSAKPLEPALQNFFFEALAFARLAEQLDAHSLCDLTLRNSNAPGFAKSQAKLHTTLAIRNIVPAPFLRPRLLAAHTATLFSATVQPAGFYADLLGLPENWAYLEVESPFEAAQLEVKVARQISTRYADRQRSLAALVAQIGAQFQARPGNYLAFFSSHDYLQQAAELFACEHPGVPLWPQARRMNEAEQQAFLQRFTPESQGIGFVVLGGSFSEGVDLPGARLIGAFIATLGLPQVNPVNEQFRARLEQLKGAGYDYTYLYPGLQKVVQAAGRVIRTTEDRGVIHLLDDRFARREVRALLPSWWRVEG